MYTVVCRRIFEAEGGVECELAKRENEMGSPVDKTVWARDEMSFRENIKTLCILLSARRQKISALLLDLARALSRDWYSGLGRPAR